MAFGELGRDAETGAQGVGVDRGARTRVVVVGELAGVVDEGGRDGWRRWAGQAGLFCTG